MDIRPTGGGRPSTTARAAARRQRGLSPPRIPPSSPPRSGDPLPVPPPSSPPRIPPRSPRPPPVAPLSPPLGTCPFGVSALMICGRNIASIGSSCLTSSPDPADRFWTVSGPSADARRSGSTSAFVPVETHESTSSSSPPARSLARSPSSPPAPWIAWSRPATAAVGSLAAAEVRGFVVFFHGCLSLSPRVSPRVALTTVALGSTSPMFAAFSEVVARSGRDGSASPRSGG